MCILHSDQTNKNAYKPNIAGFSTMHKNRQSQAATVLDSFLKLSPIVLDGISFGRPLTSNTGTTSMWELRITEGHVGSVPSSVMITAVLPGTPIPQ